MAPEADPDDGKRQGLRSWVRQLGALGHIGLMFPVAIAFGMLIGYWLDGRFGTGPWLMLAGFALGVATALRELLRAASVLGDDDVDAEEPRWKR